MTLEYTTRLTDRRGSIIITAIKVITASILAGLIFLLYYQFRVLVTYRYSTYWATVIRDYLFECVEQDREFDVGFDDIMDFDEYLWRLYTLRKSKIIKDKSKLKILKAYLSSK